MEHEFSLALVPVALMALSIGLSILAGYLLKETPKSPIRDERPTPLATRGSYVGWLSGIRRMGYVVVWAGDRRTKRVDTGKGSIFGGSGSLKTYKESAMHVICVGEVHALLEIEQSGKVIFEGPITQESHPSGTLVDLGGEGAFRIFWGEDDQPVNTYLGDEDRIGVSSRWPNFCYVEWRNKKLGAAPNWPMLSYTIERRPTGNYLTESDPWVDPTFTLDGETFNNFFAVDGALNTITLQYDSGAGNGDFSSKIRSGDRVRLTGNALSARDLNVLTAIPEPYVDAGVPTFHTVLTFEEDLTGIDVLGQIQLYTAAEDDGANVAHVIADLLFEPWPWGVASSTSKWDMDSLEAMGVAEAAMRASTVAKDAATAQETLGGILQDIGYMLPLDPTTGLLRFVPLRDVSGDEIPHIDSRKIIDGLASLEKTIGSKPVDALLFRFSDRAMSFRDMTIGRMEDGQIGLLEVARGRTIDIPNTVHYDSAAVIANRRTQEEMATAAVWDISTNRSTRELYPGQAVTVDFTSEVLRVLECLAVPDSNRVNLKLMTDNYGLVAADFVDVAPPIPPGSTPAQQDLIFDIVEMSEYFPSVPPQTVFIPRIRAHEQIDGSIIHISADNVSYIEAIETDIHYPGGYLLTPLSSDGLFEVEGTQFSVFGPDISEVLDLSGDVYNWRLGRQLCLIVSTAGVEICFTSGVTVVSGSTYTIDGLIRARYESRRLDHPVGARIYIIDVQQIDTIVDPLWAPEVTRYAKSQPFGAGIVPLDLIAPASRLLYGNGVRPSPISALSVVEPHLVNVYETGDDIVISWNYHTPKSPGTSAGLQEAGTPVGLSEPEGDFYVEILDLSDTVVRAETIAVATYTYTNANLVSDLGSEVSFKVRVSEIKHGQVSSPTTITVEAI